MRHIILSPFYYHSNARELPPEVIKPPPHAKKLDLKKLRLKVSTDPFCVEVASSDIFLFQGFCRLRPEQKRNTGGSLSCLQKQETVDLESLFECFKNFAF